MHTFIFRRIIGLRQNYWFWPSVMTLSAVILGYLLPWLDGLLGTDWMRSVAFLRATQVDGARAILTTLAGATLGVARRLLVTIVAVPLQARTRPRLIGNFMGEPDDTNRPRVSVATYSSTAISRCWSRCMRFELAPVEKPRRPSVPQISVFLCTGC